MTFCVRCGTRCNTACRSRSTCSGRARNGWTGRVSCRCRCKTWRTARRTRCCPTRRACRSTCGTAMMNAVGRRRLLHVVARRRQSAGERRQVFGFRHAGHAGRAADGQCRASVRGGPGRGIAAEALPRLCQAFYRAAGARRHCQDGVGMGLPSSWPPWPGAWRGSDGEIAAEPGQHVHPDHAAVTAAARLKTKILQNWRSARRGGPVGGGALTAPFLSKQCRPRRGWSGGRGAGRGARSAGSGQLALRY